MASKNVQSFRPRCRELLARTIFNKPKRKSNWKPLRFWKPERFWEINQSLSCHLIAHYSYRLKSHNLYEININFTLLRPLPKFFISFQFYKLYFCFRASICSLLKPVSCIISSVGSPYFNIFKANFI